MSLNTIWFRRAYERYKETIRYTIGTSAQAIHWVITEWECDQLVYHSHGIAMCVLANNSDAQPKQWIAGTSKSTCVECERQYQRFFPVFSTLVL